MSQKLSMKFCTTILSKSWTTTACQGVSYYKHFIIISSQPASPIHNQPLQDASPTLSKSQRVHGMSKKRPETSHFHQNTHVHHLWSSVTFGTSTLRWSPYPQVSRRCRWGGTVGQQILCVQKGHQGPWCQPLTPCCISVKGKGGRNIRGWGSKREKGSRT